MTLPETMETESVVQAETMEPETVAPVTLSARERTADTTEPLHYLSVAGKWEHGANKDHGPDKDYGRGPDKGHDFRFDGGKGGKK